MPFWQQLLAAVLSGLAGGGFIATLNARATRRRATAEAAKLSVDAIVAEDAAAETLLEKLTKLRAEFMTAQEHIAVATRENHELREEVDHLKAVMPLVLIAQKIQDFDLVADVFDVSGQCWTLTSIENGGTLRWVSIGFSIALGRSRDDVLRLGWRNLVHPDDVAPTATTEMKAWGETTWGFVNRMLKPDGETVWCRWFCGPYVNGTTLAYVRIEPTVQSSVLAVPPDVPPSQSNPRIQVKRDGDA